MNLKIKLYFLLLFVVVLTVPSCNLLLVAVKNVPTFFETPKKVKNKIKKPFDPQVRLSALWIGHATVLLQIDDKIIITDPLLTETAGEFARRVIEPGIDPVNIPPCDVVLISHSHFDHLNFSSLEMLSEKNSKCALIFPEDCENYLPNYNMKMIRLKNDKGYERKIAADSVTVNGVKIISVYAQHWGGRYGFDGYLWGDNAFTGYIIQYNGLTVYFAGDTGYDPVKFKEIGLRYDIDLALIPIGPCADCKQCGTYNHVFPMDAYTLYEDIHPKWMIPIHYGTLHFAQADPMEPKYAFVNLVKEKNSGDKIKVLEIGDQYIFLRK
jgi:L-ascorbate metabolism protein UlaG (beta-lactamase superfamily)